jgi:hypothetical protein
LPFEPLREYATTHWHAPGDDDDDQQQQKAAERI